MCRFMASHRSHETVIPVVGQRPWPVRGLRPTGQGLHQDVPQLGAELNNERRPLWCGFYGGAVKAEGNRPCAQFARSLIRSDCAIQVKFIGVRAILGVRSRVFQEMLYGIQTGFGSPQVPVAEILARPVPTLMSPQQSRPKSSNFLQVSFRSVSFYYYTVTGLCLTLFSTLKSYLIKVLNSFQQFL